MTQAEFVAECYSVAWASNPDLDDSSSFQDVIKELNSIKDKALRMDIIVSSFRPEPELPNFDNSPERWKKMAQDRIGNT
tara:strand:+ start:323 stop:559 length:237 start_codon:yes stop_codon:yes gene_type:complete